MTENAPMQQNPDGSWSEAVPLGWQGPENQVDFEVYRRGGRWVAEGFNRADPVGTVSGRTKLGVYFAARLKVGLRTPATFMWDSK